MGRPSNSATARSATPDDADAVLESGDTSESHVEVAKAEVDKIENAIDLGTATAQTDSTARRHWDGRDDHATAAMTADPEDPRSRGKRLTDLQSARPLKLGCDRIR